MKHPVLFVLAVILLSVSVRAGDDETRWAPGMVLIEIEENAVGDPFIDEDEFVTTGWAGIDEACRDIGINRWERIIPIAPNPEYRRRWEWTERWFTFYFDPDVTDVPTAVEILRSAQGVKYVEPNYRGKFCATPNDPYYHGHQWYIRKVMADRVWDFTQGDTAIILSAVDSGVDYLHPDLTNLIWQNLEEDADGDGQVFIPGVGFDPGDIDSIDNDGNGYIDDFIGYDWVDDAWSDAYRHPTDPSIKEDAYDYDNDPADFRYNGHGTHCTGTMTAEANNHQGIAGMTWHTQIMCLRAGYYSRHCEGYNQNEAVIKALPYGLNKGCRIFNFSYGGTDSSHLVHAIIDSAVNYWGAIITSAAGNDNNDSTHYPSAYDEVICVAATNHYDQKAYFSNFHPTVDISAPGIDIGATVPVYYTCPPPDCDEYFSHEFATGYADFQGTSMAAPVVGGAVALVWSFHPDSSNIWIRERLLENTEYIYDENPSFEPGSLLGTGRVDVYKALGAGIFPELTLTNAEYIDDGSDGRPDPGENVRVTITYENTDDPIWAAASGCTVIVTTDDPLVIISDSIGYIGNIPVGGTGSNATDAVTFYMDPDSTYGHTVRFTATLTASDRYIHIGEFEFMVGYPQVLVAARDTIYLSKVFSALNYGGIEFDTLEIVDSDPDPARLEKHRVIIFFAGKRCGIDLMTSSIEGVLENWLTDPIGADRMLVLSGQDLPEACDSAWLADLFGAVHKIDTVEIAYGLNVNGVDGDTLGDGYFHMNIVLGGGSAGNLAMGTCTAVNGGIRSMYYDYGSLDDSTCLVRREDPSGYKSVMMEFGFEGFQDSLRNVFMQRVIEWSGIQYFPGVEEKPPVKPTVLELMPPFPNPFNNAVTIGFKLFEASPVTVTVYDLTGRIVRDFDIADAPSGPNLLRWDARTENGELLPTGTYLYRVEACGKSAGGKIVYIK